MKACSYCGRENDDAATTCSGCGTAEFNRLAADGVRVRPTGSLRIP